MEQIVARLESAAAKLGGARGGDADVPVTVSEYDSFYSTAVQPFVDVAAKIEPKIAAATETSFKHVRVVIECASQCKKPADADMIALLGPIPGVIQTAQSTRYAANLTNFGKAFEELIQCHNWLMAAGPKAVCTAQLEAADFHFNKILTVAKDKEDPEKSNSRNFVLLAKAMVNKLGEYTNEFFKTGLMWKTSGGDAKSFKPGQKAAAGEKKEGFESRLEAVAASLEALAAKKAGGGGSGDEAASVSEYAQFYKTSVQPFIDSCNKMEGTKRLGAFAQTAFTHLGVVIKASTMCSKPSQADFMKFLGPIVKVIEDAEKRNIKSPTYNHETAFYEGAQGINFVCMDGNVKGYILGQIEAGAMFTNKILMAVKDKEDPEKSDNRKWVADLKAMLTALAGYADENFKMGLVWNPKGTALSAFKA
jgi:hypothetical protein